MSRKMSPSKVIAVIGTGLLWFPITATILLSIIGTVSEGRLLFDFLMPAELSLFALIGTGLLLWAAIRVHSHVKIIIAGLVLMLVMLLGSQGLAFITGMASGERPATGWPFIVVIVMLVIHMLSQIALAVIGIYLLRDTDSGSGVETG